MIEARGFWRFTQDPWDSATNDRPTLGKQYIIWPEASPYPTIARFKKGTEEDGYFKGMEVWVDDGDGYYAHDNVAAWMPCPPRPDWL